MANSKASTGRTLPKHEELDDTCDLKKKETVTEVLARALEGLTSALEGLTRAECYVEELGSILYAEGEAKGDGPKDKSPSVEAMAWEIASRLHNLNAKLQSITTCIVRPGQNTISL